MNTRERIEQAVKTGGVKLIGATEWQALREALPSLSEAMLRKHLLALEIPMLEPWRGVETHSLHDLEECLRQLTELYEAQPRQAREVVIAAKDKTRFASRNTKAASEKRALKAEMVEWMLVWLDDPRMFAQWAKLRRAVLRKQETSVEGD